MHRLAILDDYQRVALAMADWSPLAGQVEITSFDRHLGGPAATSAALAGYDIVCTMRERQPFTQAHFAGLPDLRLLVVTGPFANNLDDKAAAAHGVTVCGTSGAYGPEQFATPELTWALLMATARHVPQEHAALRAGGWQSRMGMLLHGKTLGVVGLGIIGTHVAAYGRAFGMEVIGWSPNLTAERAAAAGVRRVDKATLFAEADIVTLHLKPGRTTYGIVGAAEFALMRPGSIFINTARAALVDEAALLAALRGGRIRAGLDVFNTEPLPADHEFRRLENVVLSPHAGYVVAEQYHSFFAGTVAAIQAWQAGAPINVINAPPKM